MYSPQLQRAPVAQLDRVLGYEPSGRTFESCQAHQTNQRLTLTREPFLFHRIVKVMSNLRPDPDDFEQCRNNVG